MRISILTLLFFAALTAHAEITPALGADPSTLLSEGQGARVGRTGVANTPAGAKHFHMDRIDWTLLTADAGIRSLDVYSTHRMLAQGNYEKFLPDVISHHPANMAALEVGVVSVNYWAANRLRSHGHTRLAKLVYIVDIGQDGYWALHNLTLKSHR